MAELSLKELKDLVDENDLDLSAKQLTAVPKALAQVGRATRIDLSNNKLTVLPAELCSWVRITKLEFGNNAIVHLPDEFGRLINLKYLDLYKNNIEELPLSFADLKSLQWLDLKNNPLEPGLAKAAGKCSNDKECKEAATNVRNYVAVQREAVRKQAERNAEILQKVRDKEEAEKERQRVAEKAKKKENKKAKQQNRAERETNNKLHHESNDYDSQAATPKQRGGMECKKANGGGFAGFILGLVRLILWTFVLTSLLVGVALFVNCRFPAYRWLKAADIQPICRDTAKTFSDFSIPDTAPTSFNRALNALVQDASKRINKNELGQRALSVGYKVHATVTEYSLLVYKYALKQWHAVEAWWEKDGRDSFGGVVDSIVLTFKIIVEIAKDIWDFWMRALGVLYNRIDMFIDTIQTKGFTKTFQDFFQGTTTR